VKLIVIGCGRVGSTVAKRFASEGWDVTAIDEKESALARLGEDWTGGFIVGHGMDTAVLREAGIEEADSVVVATDGDNTNLVIAQIAKRRFNIDKVVVRVLDPMRAQWYEDQGLSTVCPTQKAIEMLQQAVGERDDPAEAA
jgi:trk system potassium uptake protein TrkA